MRTGPFQTAPGDDSQQNGFTLIELLVIIAMLAALVVVVRPALARSDDSGRRTVCTANLKRLGMAMMMYASENRDYLAFPNWDGGGLALGPGWLYTLTNGNGTIPDPGPGGPYETNQAAAYGTGLWYRYVGDPRTYLCPVDTESPSYQRTYYQGGRNNRMSSYIMNGAVCGYQSTYRSCKVTDVWSPGCYLLWEPDENALGPGNPGGFEFNDGANFPNTSEALGRLHSLYGSEVLCVGGNVQFVTRRTFNVQSASVGRGLAWWSPFSANGH